VNFRIWNLYFGLGELTNSNFAQDFSHDGMIKKIEVYGKKGEVHYNILILNELTVFQQ
jgi:hypothetical protein